MAKKVSEGTKKNIHLGKGQKKSANGQKEFPKGQKKTLPIFIGHLKFKVTKQTQVN
jgi:hypothetical protein